MICYDLTWWPLLRRRFRQPRDSPWTCGNARALAHVASHDLTWNQMQSAHICSQVIIVDYVCKIPAVPCCSQLRKWSVFLKAGPQCLEMLCLHGLPSRLSSISIKLLPRHVGNLCWRLPIQAWNAGRSPVLCQRPACRCLLSPDPLLGSIQR